MVKVTPEATLEEAARHILSIFLKFHCPAGAVLVSKKFHYDFNRSPWRIPGFSPSMEYAAGQGWVEVLPDGRTLKLTDKGFAEAQRQGAIIE